MPSSRIPSPARSLGVKSTPRRYKQRRTRSVSSPARSENTALTAILPDSFVVSPLPKRRSVLTDDTDVDMPKRVSWWKKLDENSRDVIELLEHKDIPESNNIEENFDVEILSQEKKNYTMDLPESSDGESISSIVVPQRKLFIHKENQPPKKFPLLMNNREELAKLQKSHVDHDKEIEIRPKSLFNNAKKPKSKQIFPSALLNISTDKSVANKTKEIPAMEPKGQVRNLFGNRQGNKRKNMFADFLVSESEDEIPEIQTKVFGFQNKNEQKHRVSTTSGILQQSPTLSIVDIDMDDWLHLPSSTMFEKQIEEQAATPSKRTRLNKSMETKEMDTKNKSTKLNNKSKQFSNSKAKDDFDVAMENDSNKFERDDDIASAELEGSKIEKNIITNKLISPDISKSKKSHDISMSKNKSKVSSKSLNNTLQIDCNNDLSLNKKSQEVLTSSNNSKCVDKSIVKNDRTGIMLGGDENQEIYIKSTNEIICNQTTTVNKTDKDKGNTSVLACKDVDGPGRNDVSFINHNDSEINGNKKVPQSQAYNSEIAKNIDIVHKPKESQSFGAAVDHVIDHEVSKNLNDCDVSKIQERKEESEDDVNDLSQSITEQSEQVHSEHSDDESEEHEPESEIENESEKSQNEEVENDSKESEEQSEGEQQSANEDEYELDIELDNHRESNIDHENNELNENNHASHNSKTEIKNDASAKVTQTTSFRSENHKTHETRVESPEAVLNAKTKNFIDSFTLEDRNSPRKTKSLFNQLTLRPSLAPVRESTGFSDNTGNSSANSGWDSHRTTRKTLRKTFGKDFTPSKSLRTLVMEKSAKRQTFNPDLKDLSKHPHANSTELPAHNSNKNLEENSVANSEEPMEVSSDEEKEEPEEKIRKPIEEKEKTVEEREEIAEEKEESEDEREETVEENEEEREETVEENEEEREETEEEREETVEEIEENEEEREETVEDIEENEEEKEETKEEEREESVEEKEEEREETVQEKEESVEESLDEREVSKEDRAESIEERMESMDDIEETEEDTEEIIEERVESMEVEEEIIEERDHELSKRMRQTTLEMFLQKIKKEELERHMKIREDVINSLKVKNDANLFKYPNLPVRRMAKPVQRKTNPKVRQPRTPFVIPEEVLEDLKYKPPKRFQPRNASWATKRLYKFLETKLEPKYDYMARVRAEKLVETIYEFTKQIRRLEVAPHDAVNSLKREMARLKVVDTHYEFYDFFHEYMPREVRVKVNPDPVNKIQKPRDVFANIIQ